MKLLLTILVSICCFHIQDNNIAVAITKVAFAETAGVTQENVATKLKLDSIIIAQKDYLNQIWRTKKSFDSNYKKKSNHNKPNNIAINPFLTITNNGNPIHRTPQLT